MITLSEQVDRHEAIPARGIESNVRESGGREHLERVERRVDREVGEEAREMCCVVVGLAGVGERIGRVVLLVREAREVLHSERARQVLGELPRARLGVQHRVVAAASQRSRARVEQKRAGGGR